MRVAKGVSQSNSSRDVITNKVGLPSPSEGFDGSITFRSNNGKVYLCYKLNTKWHYIELDNTANPKQRMVLPNAIPSVSGEISIFDNKIFSKIGGQRKEVLLNKSSSSIEASKLLLNQDISYNNIDSYPNDADGVAFYIGRKIGNIENGAESKLTVTNRITETGSSDSTYLAYIDDWVLDADSAGVTTSTASTLYLGKPSGSANNLITNNYSLHLSGDIKSKALTIDNSGTLDLDATGNITLDSGSGVVLDVGGTNRSINFAVAGTPFALMDPTASSTSDLVLYAGGGASTVDRFTIACAADGVTTMYSNDADGTEADLAIRADGDLILDSNNGNYIARKDGTQFSAANSAYAGMILGYTRIANTAGGVFDALINLTTTMAVIQTAQGTDVGVTFTAPPSGNVEIIFTCYLYTSSTTVAFALSDNASFNEVDPDHTYDMGSYRMDETDRNTISINWAVTGLTAGTSYTYYVGADETAGSTSQIFHGDSRGSGDHYPPITVKAIALPATITTGS